MLAAWNAPIIAVACGGICSLSRITKNSPGRFVETTESGLSPTLENPDLLKTSDNSFPYLVGSGERKFGFIITGPLGADLRTSSICLFCSSPNDRPTRYLTSSSSACNALALASDARATASPRSRLSAVSFTFPETTIPHVAITPTTSAPTKSQLAQNEINSAEGSDIPIPMPLLVLFPAVVLAALSGIGVMVWLLFRPWFRN